MNVLALDKLRTTLQAEVERVHPPQHFESHIGYVIGDWVGGDEAASENAKTIAEEHVRKHLEAAHQVGRDRGRLHSKLLLWPAAGLLFALVVTLSVLF